MDLNRQWKLPVKSMHPTIYALKALLQEQKNHREISMYLDLHGHSRKYNVFMYGVEEKKKSNPKVRAFPKFFSLHSNGKKYVSYNDCSFHVRKGREATARVVVAREIGIPLSYTVEATFCGTDDGPLKFCHMHIGHLHEVGSSLCDAFLQYAISEGDVPESALTLSRTMRADSITSDTLSNAVNAQLGRRDGKPPIGGMGRKSGSASWKSIGESGPASGDMAEANESVELTAEDMGRAPLESDSDIVTGDDAGGDGDDEESDGDSAAASSGADEGLGSKLSRSAGTTSRHVKSASSSRPSSVSDRCRSDTPSMSPQFSAEPSRSRSVVRQHARDDGFTFSNSTSGNRITVGIACNTVTTSLESQDSFQSKTGTPKYVPASLFSHVLILYRPTILTASSGFAKVTKAESMSLRPKRVSRKSAMKPKKSKVRMVVYL